MTPDDLYALPSIRREPWHRTSEEILVDAFGIDGLDRDEGAKAGDLRLVFETKLRCSLDWGERSASVTALAFDGTHFAYRCSAGRGERDMDDLVITDAGTMRAALAHLSRFVRTRDFEVVDPAGPGPNLTGFYGTAFVRIGGRVRMVRDDRVSADGGLMFDDEAWGAAFDADVRPAFGAGKEDWTSGLENLTMRRLSARAAMAAFPEGARAVVVDRKTRGGDWVAAACATDEGTYVAQVPSYAMGGFFSWVSELVCDRLGGPEAFDAIEAEMSSGEPVVQYP